MGDQLFFVAYRKDSGYSLTAYMMVADLIGQDEAVARFPGRCNVILDRLPDASTLADSVRLHLASHSHDLAWPSHHRNQAMAVLHDRSPEADVVLQGFTVSIGGAHYVHAYYDEHEDWKEGILGRDGRLVGSGRIRAPYVVADEIQTKILAEPIHYPTLYADCPSLPATEELRNGFNQHPARRVQDGALTYLHAFVAAAEARTVPPYSVAGPLRPCSERSPLRMS